MATRCERLHPVEDTREVSLETLLGTKTCAQYPTPLPPPLTPLTHLPQSKDKISLLGVTECSVHIKYQLFLLS